jgi:hypothetical protein
MDACRTYRRASAQKLDTRLGRLSRHRTID